MEEQKKILYIVFGAAVAIHIGIIVSKWVAILAGVGGFAVLLVALWKATTGRRLGLNAALVASLAVHAVAWIAVLFFGLTEEEEGETLIRFQAPPPILEKNFDLAKQPEISEVQMEMLAALTPPDMPTDITAISDVSAVGSDLLGAVLPGASLLGTFSGAKAEELDFDRVEMIDVTETAAPVQEMLSLERELLNVGDLDFGRFKAIIITDPENKKNIRGFFNMTIVDYDLADKNVDRFPLAVEELMRYVRDHTQIKAKIQGTTLRFSDDRIHKAPLLYMTGNSAIVQLSDTEKANLGEYLRGGGFLFAEDIRQNNTETNNLTGTEAGVVGTPFDRQFKALVKDPLVLGTDGAKFQKIPKSHSLYYTFFDFQDGPPMGGAAGGNVFDLEMLELRGRVAVLFSDLNISWYWGQSGATARERGLQFGVNLIVYALTQPGGISNVTQYTQ